MKKILNYILLLSVMLYTASCDEGFDELNLNKVSATAIDPSFQLNAATLGLSFPVSSLVYEIGIVQQIISPNSGVLTGANYNQDNRASTQGNWQSYYRNTIKNTKDVISQTKTNPARANLYNMARIVQANAFMVLTDSYGSIPYSEGGAGYTNQVFFPIYDSQQTIYADIIKELTEASAALNPSGKVETADILYSGNIVKWKAFGNSLLLRAGMRLSKVDPTKAAQVAAAAFQGGVITMNSDNAIIKHDANYANPIGNLLNATEAANFYMTEPFVNYLRATNDPRLSAIAVTYVGAKSGPEQTVANQTYSAAVHKGMPMGNDNAGAVAAAKAAGLASFYEFAQVDRRRLAKIQAQALLVTASQNLLLLAEARQRGWITASTASDYYNAGVRAHMEQLTSMDANMAISGAATTAYLAENPYLVSTGLNQINTQYWVSSLMNGPEAFANFRRSGFPVLLPNPFPGREVPFINRLTYPNSEISVNSKNVNAAISAQGADNLATKVWWDK